MADDVNTCEATDKFKVAFKFYKRKDRDVDLSYVIDFDQATHCDIQQLPFAQQDASSSLTGMKLPTEWKMYALKDCPGFFYILNPFLPGAQRYWIKRCLRDFHRPPYRTNLSAHVASEDTADLWNQRSEHLKKLRWSTLGYQHNWDTKKYSEADLTPFPEDVALLSRFVATAIAMKDFRAQAAITNYYHLDSTLSGHTDHSELDLEAPLFSFSFGASAIFLLGGPTKATPPRAMLVRSGDVIVMGRESRLCYHAVPRILPPEVDRPAVHCYSSPPHLEQHPASSGDSPAAGRDACGLYDVISRELMADDWAPFEDFIRTRRINLNVRQVLPPGVDSLPTETTDTGCLGSPVSPHSGVGNTGRRVSGNDS